MHGKIDLRAILGAAKICGTLENCLLVSVLALLVGNTTAGLAGRLAGSLALAAAAVLGALAQVAGLQSLNLFHSQISNLLYRIWAV